MNANEDSKHFNYDEESKITSRLSVRPELSIADEGRRGFKWSFGGQSKQYKSRTPQQKRSSTNRSHPYADSPQYHKASRPQQIGSTGVFLPPKITRNPSSEREKIEADRLAQYKLKNPGLSSKQVMELELKGIELRKQRSVDLSRGLLSLKQATTQHRNEDLTPRDADDDEYHKRLADRSKLKRKNYSALFMKAFFEEANAIALQGTKRVGVIDK